MRKKLHFIVLEISLLSTGQFLHEIRTLTLELKKSRDQEAALQAQLDEVIEKMQEKSFEINRISKEESELRGTV